MCDMDENTLINRFIALSRYAGSRFDLIQAGGGNSSIKLDHHRMLVKASGCHLSEVEFEHGYAVVDYAVLATLLETPIQWCDEDKHRRDENVSRLVRGATKPSGARASLEVFMHAVLGRFVLHTHPIAVNIIASQSDWDKNFANLFPEALCIPYYTPGIELGLELSSKVKAFVSSHGYFPEIIFLQNHGLIVSAETMGAVKGITEDVIGKCGAWSNVDFSHYQAVTAIAEYVGDGSVAYLCEDRVIMDLLKSQRKLFSQQPISPDSFVYCGVVPLVVDNLGETDALDVYRKTYQDIPKVISYQGRLYFIAKTIKKAREVEDVYKAHLLTLVSMKGRVSYLSHSELAYLGSWEAEKYRREK